MSARVAPRSFGGAGSRGRSAGLDAPLIAAPVDPMNFRVFHLDDDTAELSEPELLKHFDIPPDEAELTFFICWVKARERT